MKAKQNILFGILLCCILILTRFLWKPWGYIVLCGLLGIFFLRGAIFWRRAKMIYMAIYYAVWTIVSLVVFVQSLVMHKESYPFWIVFPAAIIAIIMMEIEERKNPDKMEKWKSAWKNVSFFKLLWFHIPDLDDKEKPENKEG